MNRSDGFSWILLASEINSWPVLKMTPSLQISHDPTWGSGSFSEDLPQNATKCGKIGWAQPKVKGWGCCRVSKINWLVVWNIFYFSIYREFHHPSWRTHIFQRGRYTTNQINIDYPLVKHGNGTSPPKNRCFFSSEQKNSKQRSGISHVGAAGVMKIFSLPKKNPRYLQHRLR